MAVRNLTSKFEEFRTGVRSRRSSVDGSGRVLLGDGRAVKDPLLDASHFGGSDVASIRVSGLDGAAAAAGMRHSLPPDWVNLTDKMQVDLRKVQDYMRDLRKLHDDRLKVTFSDKEAEQERDIEVLTGEITKILKSCETSLKRISNIGVGVGVQLPKEEKTVRLNVMRALGAQLSQLSREFRKSQKEFVTGLSGQEDAGITLSEGKTHGRTGSTRISLEEAMDRGLTRDQQQQLDLMRQSASDRDKEIIRIAQSVNELAQVFKELNMLVIEQGSLLDRIDYNIESALTKVKEGVVQVQKANQHSKKALKLKCIVCLLVMILVLSGILVLKKTSF